MLMSDSKKLQRAAVARAARLHWVGDEEILRFFQKFVSKTPHELREVLDDPAFNAGFVAGLAYVRSQVPGDKPKRGDVRILERVMENVIEATKQTPYVSNN